MGEVFVGDYEPGGAVFDDVFWASVGCDDGGDCAGEGFEDYVAEGVGVGGEDEKVHVGVGGGEGFAAKDSGEGGFGGGEGGAEGGFFAAVADDEEVDVVAERCELPLDDGEESYVFFDGEATYVAEYEFGFVCGSRAAVGVEEVGVYAALHEVAGCAGGGFELGAEFAVGGEEDLGFAVEPGDGGEGEGLGAGLGAGCVGGREM